MLKNIDDLFEQVQRDELADTKYLTPIDMSKILDCRPQSLYYHLRRGHLEFEVCQCGRKVLNVEETLKWYEKQRSSSSNRKW